MKRSAVLTAVCALSFCPILAKSRPPLPYGPETVSVVGWIRVRDFPGPPNYENIAGGDKLERYWILQLDQPVDVAGSRIDAGNEPEPNVREMQLVFLVWSDGKSYADFRKFLGQTVAVSGQLSHAINGHHHTAVLLEVKTIVPATPSVKKAP